MEWHGSAFLYSPGAFLYTLVSQVAQGVSQANYSPWLATDLPQEVLSLSLAAGAVGAPVSPAEVGAAFGRAVIHEGLLHLLSVQLGNV